MMSKQSTRNVQTPQLLRASLALALALVGGVSVGTRTASAQSVERQPSRVEAMDDGTVQVQVRNNGWRDVRVYAVRQGRRYRLGMVTGLTSATLRIPRHLLPDSFGVQLLAVPMGAGRGHVSPIVYVTEGERLFWSLESNLNLSSLVRVS